MLIFIAILFLILSCLVIGSLVALAIPNQWISVPVAFFAGWLFSDFYYEFVLKALI